MTGVAGRPAEPDLDARICGIVGRLLHRPVTPATRLLGTPGFDSLAIAGLVEQIEDTLGIEFAPDLLVPETFTDVAALAGAAAATPAVPGRLQPPPSPERNHVQ